MTNHFYLFQVIGEMKRYINTFGTELAANEFITDNPLLDGEYELRSPKV